MGEAVLQHIVNQRKLNVHVSSCGTAGYHVGEEPDERTTMTCKKHNVPISHEAQQISQEHFKTYDYILAADNNNLANLERIKPKSSKAVVRLFGSYDDGKPIQDPYYGGLGGFESCYQQCVRYSNKFLDTVFPETPSSNL